MRKSLLILLLIIVWSNSPGFAQKAKYIHMPEHDDKAYYFGLAFGGNASYFQIKPTKSFYNENKFQQIQGQWGPGFSVGIMSHLKLSNFVDLRFIPSIIFTEGGILLEGEGYEIPKVMNLEAIYMQLPLHFKFKSDRIDNFRFYAVAGMRFDYDLASNAKSRRADEWLRVKPIDIGVDFGIGLEFYFPNFIFAPEIKIGQGVMNRLKFDPDINLSYEIDKIQSRMITFSIHLQG
ncbi:MAG TPA: outer membrane beta-barrel protein [Chitinophagaceae bacterium]|nr:outer membrane beta-barrel protein [Chitinophagaceae bacterium]